MISRRLSCLLLSALAAAPVLAPSGAVADAQDRVAASSSAAPTYTPANTGESSCTHPGSKLRSARIAAGCCVATKGAGPASSAVQGRLLKRQLASESQMAGPGTRIFGAGTSRSLREGPRLAERYGGDAADYAKMTSPRYRDGGGTYDVFETHWYQNVRSGARYEFKTKFPRAENIVGGRFGP